jgi:hypothetical protein
MSENTVKHLIATAATLTCLLIWWSGYYAGLHGWWFFFLFVGIIYAIMLKLIDV